MISADFNIHDILKIKYIWKRKYRCILKDLDLKLNYFSAKNVADPDITVEIGAFSPNLKGCRVYERRFFVSEGFVYAIGGNWQTKWAIQVSGLDEGKLFVKVNCTSKSIRGFLAPNMLVNILVLPLLELKFLEKGYVLLHSAAVSKNGNGYLIVGRGGSAKTSIVMDLIRKYGYEYMGDDRVLIGSGIVMSFPTHIQTFEYLLKNSENEFMNVFTRLRLINYLLRTKQIKIKVTERSPLRGILFVTPSAKSYTIKNLNSQISAKKMVANMLMEYFEMSKIVGLNVSPIFECFTAYSAAYPNSIVARFQENLLSSLETELFNLPIYEISFPSEYSGNVASVINTVLSTKMGIKACMTKI
ncbi:MAG: hypothetical protein QXN87_03765 [Candidatus Bathyarchaeia archaeon]